MVEIYMIFWGIQSWNMVMEFFTKLHVESNIERPLRISCDNKSVVLYFNNNRGFDEIKIYWNQVLGCKSKSSE